MTEHRSIDVDTASMLPDSSAHKGMASLHVDTKVATRFLQNFVETKVWCVVCLKLLAEKGRINPGFTCPVIIECHLKELEVLRAQIRHVFFGDEDPADSAAVPVEALDEQLFQRLTSQMLGEHDADGD